MNCPKFLSDIEPWAYRFLFVFALRRRYPRFFKSLNTVWREGLVGLADWGREANVLDSWLADYVDATIEAWSQDPDGPNATLAPDHLWFAIPVQVRSEVPDFQPVFDNPYPISSAPDDSNLFAARISSSTLSELRALLDESVRDEWFETPEAFQERMEKQFREQLTQYTKVVRSAYGYKATPQTQKNADWTALAFGGLSYADIVRWDFEGAPHQDPESAVRKAVIRFAAEIGLTLPSKTSLLSP